MSEEIRVMIVEDEECALNVHIQNLKGEDDIVIVAHANNKELAIQLAEELNPDILLLDINLTPKEDQHGIDVAIHLSISRPDIKIIMLSGLLNEDTVRSTIGLGVACNYLIKSRPNNIPKEIRNVYQGLASIEGTVIDFILMDYKESLKFSMNKLTSQHIKILELFYRGYSIEEVADILKLEIQSVRNHQQAISKRCLGWKWMFRRLNTLELANRAKVMGLF